MSLLLPMPVYTSAGSNVRAAPIVSIVRGGALAAVNLGDKGRYTLPADWFPGAQPGGYLVWTNAFDPAARPPPHIVVYRSAAEFAANYTPE